jgi:tetratricopeptide (TPR) repeat protein
MKWNSLILSLILAAGVLVARPQTGMGQTGKDNAEARRLYNEARDFFDDGNYADAEKKLREAMTKYPKADQVDRSSYLLIKTLEKLRRYQDANSEIENFYRSYPGSRWRQDVDQESLALGVSSNSVRDQEAKIAKERALSQQLGSTALPPNSGMEAMILQRIIHQSPNEGIETIKERLKKDPSDPAVIANLGTVFNSHSPLALPFLLDLATSAGSPNTRTIAFFYAMRLNPDKVQVANTLMEMLGKKENESIVSEALFRMTYEEHRQVLAKIVASPNPGKFDAIGKIYRSGSITLRSDLLTAVAALRDDPKAESFIIDAAQNDKDLAVRRAAIEALMIQKRGADVKSLENLLSVQPPKKTAPPVPVAPVRVAPSTNPATIPAEKK